jgi:ABC-2 type transport system ATP-binding protein
VIDHGRVIAEGTADQLKDRVGGERLDVELVDPAMIAAAIDALDPIAAERPTADGATVHVPLRERAGAIAEAVRRLDAAGVALDDVTLRRPTLDDVFISLTGHAAEEAGAGAGAEAEAPHSEAVA